MPINKISSSFKKRLLIKARFAARFFLHLVSSDLFLKLTFSWFILQAVFFALTTKYGVMPDEVYHLTYIKLFAEHTPTPFLTGLGSYNILLEVTRNPFYIYHYLLSFPYLLIRNSPYAFVIIRMFSVPLGVGSLYLVKKISDIIKCPKLVRNISIFMLSNTLMFVFIFGSITYDTLFIFLSLAVVFVLLNLLGKVTAKYLLYLIAIILGGLMTKINFIPVAVIVMGILAAKYYSRLPQVFLSFKHSFKSSKTTNIILCVVIGLLGILFIQKYAVNIIKYKTYQPDCSRVLKIEDCRKNVLYSRNEKVYGPDKRIARESIFNYWFSWLALIQDRTFGIFSHKKFNPNSVISFWAKITIVVCSAAVIRMWSKKDRYLSILLLIALFYTCVLFILNYHIYLKSGRPGFVVHGRYLFGVLPLFYLVANYYTLKFLSLNVLKSIYISMIIVVFSISSLPTYLRKATPDWYTKQSVDIYSRFRNVF